MCCVIKGAECYGKKEYLDESRELLENLRNNKLKRKLPVDHIKKYTIDWTEHGVDPTKEESHRLYISKLADDFEKSIKDGIQRAIQEKQSNILNNTICQEVIQHINFCKNKCHSFYGRKDTFEIIEDYLMNNSDEPLVIHGSSGCGKTSIVAMAAKHTFDKEKEKETTIVIRFLGTTPDSSNISALLYSVISQIKLVYEEEPIKEGLSLKVLTKEFHLSLEHAGEHRPLVVLLDSLDQLETTGGAHELSWLPRKLPEYVKMIVSTLPEAKYGCFSKLQAMFSTTSCFLPVETLSNDDVEGILHKWLETNQRKLLDSQLKIILDAFHQCPLPLFLKLSFDVACRWKSFTPPSVSTLQTTVRNVINDLFTRVESLHGQLLVSRALGYLTLSGGGGLSEAELEHILSCDDDVLNDVYMYWTPPIRRLPPLLLVRIKTELGQYFVDRGADGVRVFYWFHRQFIEAATERYCSDVNIKLKMCGAIADFFSGIWANGKGKPFKTKSGESSEADRYVTSQPVKLGELYNLRKLNNLPHHRQQAYQLDLLKSECLCNFYFILHKIKALGLRPVLDDFSSAKEQFVDDEDIKSICDALELSQRSVQYNSNELPSQLLGRLKPTESLRPLLDDCKNSPFYYLLPDKTILAQPGGSLLYCLSNHTGDIQGLDITKDGELAVTCSTDRTIKTWSVKSGKLVRSYDIGFENLEYVKLCHNDQIIVVSGRELLVGVDFLTGVNLYKIENESETVICAAGKDKDVLGIFQQNGVTLYSALTGELQSHTKCQFLEEKMSCVEEEVDIEVAYCTSQGRYMAWVFKRKLNNRVDALAIFDIIERKFLNVTVEPLSDKLVISPDETNIVICNDDDEAVIYDIQTMNEIRRVQITRVPYGRYVQITPNGKYLYWAYFYDVVACNLETGEMFVAVHHPSSVKFVITLDMNSIVTVGKDQIVRIWDQSKDNSVINQEAQQKQEESRWLSGLTVLSDNPRYIIIIYEQNDSYYFQIYDLATNMVVKNTKFVTKINFVLPVDDTQCLIQHGKKISLLDLQTSSIIRTYQGQAPTDPVINSPKTEFYTLSRGRMNIKKYNIETGVCEIIKGCGERLGDYIVNKICTVLAASMHDDEWVVFFDLVNKRVMYQLTPEMIEGDDENESICLNDGGLVTDDGRYFIFSHMLVPPDLTDVEDAEPIELVVMWNIPDKKLHQILCDHNNGNEDCCVADVVDFHILNEKTVITTNSDYYIRVYDIETGNVLRRLTTGHFSRFVIVLNKDSPFFLSYAKHREENSIRLWDKETFGCLASYCMDTQMKSVEFTSDGYHIIVTYDDDGHVKFDLKGGDSISKYQPPKQLEQCKELFKPTDKIVELEIPSNVIYDNPDPDTDE
ncbi:NACHT domain- and WD repeat-containing protein 1 [Patella vulgata]|uniref:NACHT domain- and WD repeat-containing protein 1 n=1 Tax=Patella vulgata TaxID=6465 RepID=UPI0024A7CFAA|nr:NACHT domain- and WD repeat-containing protein 1 [Patella vulgata]